MSTELQKLAHQVALGALDALPNLMKLALREEQVPVAGPPQIMIRSKRTGKFWTGGRRARGKEWDRVMAQTYQSMASAKRAAGSVRVNQQYRWVSAEEVESFCKQVVVTETRRMARLNKPGMAVWFYEPIEIVEIVPVELRVTPVESKK